METECREFGRDGCHDELRPFRTLQSALPSIWGGRLGLFRECGVCIELWQPARVSQDSPNPVITSCVLVSHYCDKIPEKKHLKEGFTQGGKGQLLMEGASWDLATLKLLTPSQSTERE